MRRLLSAMLMFCSLLPLGAQAEDVREYQLKAAYIFNFINAVEWPAEDGVFRLGVLGSDPFGESLEALTSRDVRGQKLEIVHLRNPQFENLDAVFVSVSQIKDLELIVHSLEGLAVLSISDIPDFGKAGGAITFFNQDNRMRFSINQGALDKAGLKASKELLRLAEKSP